jgi:hypothetical protein
VRPEAKYSQVEAGFARPEQPPDVWKLSRIMDLREMTA